MFTEVLLIRKNTAELREMMLKLGYECINSVETTLDAHNYDGKGNHKSIEEGNAIITSYGGYYGVIYDIDEVAKKGRIDCGTNEKLFLALAALRDDTDKNQWFINKESDKLFNLFKLEPEYDSLKQCFEDCRKEMKSECKDKFHLSIIDSSIENIIKNTHKMSAEELIEHFKDK